MNLCRVVATGVSGSSAVLVRFSSIQRPLFGRANRSECAAVATRRCRPRLSATHASSYGPSVGRVLVAVLLTSCGGPRSAGEPQQTPAASSTAGLNEVELDCRSDEMLSIGQLSRAFGPTCSGPTMSLALKTFDLGTHNGFTEAKEWKDTQTMLCMCTDGACSEEQTLRAMDDAKRVMVEDVGKREREGVARMTNSLMDHSCLDASIGVELFKLGFRCAFTKGLTSRVLHRKRVADFATVFKVDNMKAEEQAAACDLK